MNEELLEEFKNILKEKNIDINSILDNSNSDKNTNEQNQNNVDIDTLLKIKTIFEKLNSNTSKNVNLLIALKPFLRKTRKDKIDDYIQMLKIAEITKEFGFLGGDKK